jgi:hypothetical protein
LFASAARALSLFELNELTSVEDCHAASATQGCSVLAISGL